MHGFVSAAHPLARMLPQMPLRHLRSVLASLLLVLLAPPQVLALAPGTEIVNRASVTFHVGGAAHVVEDDDTLVAAADAGNSPPHGVLHDGPGVPENSPGAHIGMLRALDVDPGQTFTFASEDPRFNVTGERLSLAPGVALDFERASSITVGIVVTDSAGARRVLPLVIAVTDVNERPFGLRIDSGDVPAGVAGAAVGVVHANDPDTGDLLTYAVDDARFLVREGQLRLRDSTRLEAGEVVVLTLIATDRGGLDTTTQITLRSIPVERPPPSPARAEFLLPVTSGVESEVLQPGRCPGEADAGVPRNREGQALQLPAALPVVPTSLYTTQDTIFLRVVDTDQNLDNAQQERVEVRLDSGSDVETVSLIETRVDSGVFTGFVGSTATAHQSGDCRMGTSPGGQVRLAYADTDDASDVATALAVYAPLVRIWAADTGEPLNGVGIVLLDPVAGQPAQGALSGTSGSTYPVALRTGEAVRDGAGVLWQPPAGGVLLPALADGTYRFLVTPPSGYRFPSRQTDVALERVSRDRYHTAAGSRGETFVVAGGAGVMFDIPLDPDSGDFFLTKEASTDVVEIGDRVQYRVRLQTDSGRLPAGSVIEDLLPRGFVYEPGSGRLNDRPVEPELAPDGRRLRFSLDGVSSNDASAERVLALSYVTEVTVGARQGNARNLAMLAGNALPNGVVASADVMVRNSVLTDRAFLTGRVAADCDPAAAGVAQVRVLLEDGTFAISDANGRFHFEDLAAGTHVVQIDTATLPAGLQTVACEASSRMDRGGGVQFVDLKPGALGRVDFALTEAPPPVTAWSVRLDSKPAAGGTMLRLRIRTGALDAERGRVGLILPAGLALVPGSVRLNDAPLGDPLDAGDGALSLRLPALARETTHRLTLHARASGEVAALETGALVTLHTASGSHRSSPVRHIAAAPEASPPMLVKMRADSPGSGGPQDPEAAATTPARVMGTAVMSMPLPVTDETRGPAYELPSIDNGHAPVFTLEWLRTQPDEPGIVWPPADYNPRIPAVPIIVKHPAGRKPVVRVDGRLVDAVAFEGTLTDPVSGMTLSTWKDVPVSERDSRIEVRFLDGDVDTGIVLSRSVHFGQVPVRAEFVPERSWLIADGVNPPMIAVRLFDRSGRPARPGLSGEFNVNAPFEPLDKAEHLEVATSGATLRSWQVRRDGIAFIQLEPTTRTGDVVLSLVLEGRREEKIRARLKPGAQDLVVVGLAESAIGHIETDPLESNDSPEGRVAFYAKGEVRNGWQVTAAYDSDREFDRSRHRQIDPGQFYPLYGDGSTQRYDAVSQRKLYLRAEKEQVEFEAGDFTTGFERSELARYQRALNGARAAWRGRGARIEGFASDSGETHVQDVLRGDGTSGLYRLRRAPLIGGTEVVALVTRDRLHSERVLQRLTLMRYLDYSIDYDRGTLLFKQPVLASDNQFNPVSIEVTYDVEAVSGGRDLVTGLRASLHSPDQSSEAGVTVLRDEAAGEHLALDAIDLHWRVSPGTTVTLEAAQTRSDSVRPAEAWIASIDHRGQKLGGQVYFRQQDADFGIGLSPATEVDTRKYGLEGEYRATDALLLRAQAFRQETMKQGGQRDVAGVEARYSRGSTVYRSALQSVRETAVTGEALASDLLGIGVARGFFDGRLALRVDSDVNLRAGSGSAAYPDRTVAGAEYLLDDAVTLLLEQELSSGGYGDARQTRVGVRTRPWTGHHLESWVGQEMTENGPRLFANTGLVQQWQVNPHWLIDAGMDQVKTLKGAAADAQSGLAGYPTFNPAAPATAGSDGTDFTAWFAGATMRRDAWHVSTRVERHAGDLQDKWNWLFGAARELENGKALSASAGVMRETGDLGSFRRSLQLRFGMALRPEGSPWAVFNRLDLNLETTRSNGVMTRQDALVENLHVNWRKGRHEAGFQGGLRFAHSEFDSVNWDGFTGLAGAQYRFDLNSRWDVGAHLRVLRSFGAGVTRWNSGVEVGRAFGRQVWVSAGWNFSGFEDPQFAAAEYTRAGPYLKFRMRFDQDTVRRYLGFITADHARPAAREPAI